MKSANRMACVAIAAVGVLGLGALSVGCGPSYQAVYEGDVRFEHCYAVDESTQVRLKDKADCWRDWMKNYTYAQTRDRIEYASSRSYALSMVPEQPTDDVLMQAAPGGGVRKKVIAAPMPTSVHEPPPNTMPESDRPAPSASADPKTNDTLKMRAPGTECTDACNTAWTLCTQSCKAKACDECSKTLRTCGTACFKEEKAAPKKR